MVLVFIDQHQQLVGVALEGAGQSIFDLLRRCLGGLIEFARALVDRALLPAAVSLSLWYWHELFRAILAPPCRFPSSDSLRLNFNFGILLEQSEPGTAAAEFRRALNILPGDYGSRQKLAETLIRMRNYEDGIGECRTLLTQKPYHAPAHFTMAYALAQLQQFDESIAAY
jgi:tetratricopeptide (TPR) repeat protein